MELTLTLAIIATTVLVSLATFSNEDLNYKLPFLPYLAKHQNQWWRVISHGFVHGDHMHLFFNMYVLYNFGELIEKTLQYQYGTINGTIYFLGLYIGGLIFATIPAFYKNSNNSAYRAVGASGAVSSVLFAFIIFYPSMNLRLLFIPIDIPAYIMGGLYLAFETYSNKQGRTNIAHDAHIAGAIFGIVYVVLLDFNNFTNFFTKIGF